MQYGQQSAIGLQHIIIVAAYITHRHMATFDTNKPELNLRQAENGALEYHILANWLDRSYQIVCR